MNDSVSRQAAIDEIKRAMCEDGFRSETGVIHKTTAYDIIRHLPPAEPEQRWIPVSEKLPDPDVDVLLQLSDVMATGYYFYDGWHVYFSPKRKDVIAWRELPEPYKGGQE